MQVLRNACPCCYLQENTGAGTLLNSRHAQTHRSTLGHHGPRLHLMLYATPNLILSLIERFHSKTQKVHRNYKNVRRGSFAKQHKGEASITPSTASPFESALGEFKSESTRLSLAINNCKIVPRGQPCSPVLSPRPPVTPLGLPVRHGDRRSFLGG